MDDDDDPCHDNCVDNATCCHETQQPMDLLAIQQEIHQTMTSMQLFFSICCTHHLPTTTMIAQSQSMAN